MSASAATYALHTAQGPATVTVNVSGDRLEASADGPGAASALRQVPRTVGLEDRPEDFPAGNGVLRDLHRRHPGLRLGSTGRVFDALIPTVLGQRVTTDEAKKSYRAMRFDDVTRRVTAIRHMVDGQQLAFRPGTDAAFEVTRHHGDVGPGGQPADPGSLHPAHCVSR